MSDYTDEDLKQARDMWAEMHDNVNLHSTEEAIQFLAGALRARERKGYKLAAFENEDSVKLWTKNAREGGADGS